MNLSQSTVLVGLLAAAFVLYVTAKGRLPAYTQVLLGPAPKDTSGSGGSSSGGSGGSSGSGGVAGTGLDWGDIANLAVLAAG